MSNAESNSGLADIIESHHGLVPYSNVKPLHTNIAWAILIGTSLGVLGMILVRFLTYDDTLKDWVETVPIAPIAIAIGWLLFFLTGLWKSVVGRRTARGDGDLFRFDLFIASVKLCVAGSVYCVIWLLLLLLVHFSFSHKLPLLLAACKLASTHFIFAAIFRTKLETCLLNIVAGCTYVALGVVLYKCNDDDVFLFANYTLAGSVALVAILMLFYYRWMMFLSFGLLSSSFILAALSQSRYAVVLASMGSMIVLLITTIPAMIEGLSAIVAMLFGSWDTHARNGLSSVNSTDNEPHVEAEPLLSARSEQFKVIKN